VPFDPTIQSRQSTGQFGSRIFQKDKADIEALLNDAHGPIDLHGKVLRGQDFSYAHLDGANLSGADLTGANFAGAHLTDANLNHANLTAANLTGADLKKANLRRANLTEANLEHSDVRGADLTDADLSSTRVIFAKCDRSTVWPYEFEMRLKRL
jgi:uncharacterized protein YjbI with pentapeptide repeats